MEDYSRDIDIDRLDCGCEYMVYYDTHRLTWPKRRRRRRELSKTFETKKMKM